jgi:hypothetical protein
MSVDSVTKMWSRTLANYTSEKFDQFDTTYILQEAYQVTTSADTDVPEVLSHPDVPKASDQHPAFINAWVRSRDIERVSPILWMVTIGYEGYDLDLWSFDLEWTDTTSTEPIDRDINGRAIVTACNEPVMGLTVDIPDTVAVIRRKFLFVNPFVFGAYRMATNSDTFLGWPPGTARLVGYSAPAKFKRGGQLDLYDVTARIQFRYPYGGASAEQAWYKRWRHEGLYVRDPIFGTNPLPPFDQIIIGYRMPYRARDINGLEVSTPVMLTDIGQQETNPDNAVYRYTQVYDSLPFNALGLI